jgi:ribonuclease D
VLSAPGVEKVFHAGQQDLDLFHSLTGVAPAPILDTQVAAALAGHGAQVGYAQLVERLLGVTVDKSETLTDWSRRPLTKAQLAYAVDDVRYLLPSCDALKKQLDELGRWDWAVEECRRLERSVRSMPIEPEDAWLRVRGRGSLRARGLVVLRALAEWREEIRQDAQQAARDDRPRRSVGGDRAQGADDGRGPARPARRPFARSRKAGG